MKQILKKAKIDATPSIVTPLSGGANNRVYRLDFSDHESLVLKHYFEHPNDLRKRLESEYAFLSYAWNCGIRQIPKPIASDLETNQALYSVVPGSAPKAIDEEMLDQAIHFFLKLNENKCKRNQLPFASEHCMKIGDFFSTVESKLKKCRSIDTSIPINRDVKYFIETSLVPRFTSILKQLDLDLNDTIAEKDLCISPSDFGFHNALSDKGKLYFIDFEYAGWDDPTKTVCDFFCQPKIPVPSKYFDKVTEALVSTTQNPEVLKKRIQKILPVCQIKWCCIILNSFQKIGRERRNFSDPNLLEKLESQFTLAKNYLERIPNGIHRSFISHT